MKWEEFTFSALQALKPTLDRVEYQIALNGTGQGKAVGMRGDQYELLGMMRIKQRLIQMMAWRLGLENRAVEDLIGAASADLAQQFGTVLAPLYTGLEVPDWAEKLGKRMIGFLYARYSAKQAGEVVVYFCKRLHFPRKISFEAALAVHNKATVAIERINFTGDDYPTLYRIVTDNAVIQDSSRDTVAHQYLLQQFGTDLRELKCVPRYRRHHAPLRWASWLLPNKFATHWQLSVQDALDLMDDSSEHHRDRKILERIGEIELRSMLLRYTICYPGFSYRYNMLCQRLAKVLIMPGYVQYPEDREDFLRQLVGFWRVKYHAVLPALRDELERYLKVMPRQGITPMHIELSSNSDRKIRDVEPKSNKKLLEEYFKRVANGEGLLSLEVEVNPYFPGLLNKLSQLGPVTSVEWFGRGVQLDDTRVMAPLIHQIRQNSGIPVSIFGRHIPDKARYIKPNKKATQVLFHSLYTSGVKLEHTAAYESMGSLLQVNYHGQTIIIQSATTAELAFAKRGRNHHPRVRFTICTYKDPLAQQITRQKQACAKNAQQHVSVTDRQKKQSERYAHPQTLTSTDYFKQRLSEVTDTSINLDYSPRYLGHEIASGRSESNVWSVANTD